MRKMFAAIVVVGLAGCSEGFTRDGAVESFVAVNTEASTDEAGCVVDDLIEQYGLEGLELELQRESPTESFATTQFRAMFACGMTSGVESSLTEQLQARGLAPAQAACAAEALTGSLDQDDLDVLISGELTDAFFDKYFVALEACDALPD